MHAVFTVLIYVMYLYYLYVCISVIFILIISIYIIPPSFVYVQAHKLEKASYA